MIPPNLSGRRLFPYFAETLVMFRIGFVLLLWLLAGCNNKKTGKDENGFSYKDFSELFPASKLPYQITDAEVWGNKDTTSIRSPEFAQLIPDSLKTKLFGKNRVRYIAVAKIPVSKYTTQFVIKAIAGNKKMALLMPFTNKNFDAVIPFLIPDNDASTTQTTSIERSGGVIKNISQRKPGGVIAEGRDVYQYIPESKQFILVLTNPLNSTAEIINPIDTLPRKYKFSGDYIKGKKNFVSVRDGRSPSQLLVFIHIEKGDCSGEIKSEVLMTSGTTAIYRQSGDPCGLTFRFTASSVTVKEEGGCGSRRGLDCSFDGTFNKKKEAKTKSTKKKPSSK